MDASTRHQPIDQRELVACLSLLGSYQCINQLAAAADTDLRRIGPQVGRAPPLERQRGGQPRLRAGRPPFRVRLRLQELVTGLAG